MRQPLEYLENATWNLGVVGLGYVGLPMLVSASQKGLGVVGFDVSDELVDALTGGRSHIDDVMDADVARVVASGGVFSADPDDLEMADVILICVPSPLSRNRDPDLSYIESAADTIARVSRPGQLVVLESTTYPGTTEELIVPAVEKAGRTLDEDVWVAYSPERVSPGGAMKSDEIPKVVGGVTPMSGEVAAMAYRRLVPAVHVVSTARAAEMSKLLENTYRAVNIGLINEVSQLSHELDIDIWEVIDAAATKPFGFEAFYPGPGVGGHCIPLDPQFLAWSGRAANVATRFIETAEQINSRMPDYVLQRATDILNEIGKPVRDSRILAVGMTYKPDISDYRESASLRVAGLIQARGADVSFLDPYVSDETIAGHGFEPDNGRGDYDLALVLTDHSVIDYRDVLDRASAVFDTRGVYRRLGLLSEKVIPL